MSEIKIIEKRLGLLLKDTRENVKIVWKDVERDWAKFLVNYNRMLEGF